MQFFKTNDKIYKKPFEEKNCIEFVNSILSCDFEISQDYQKLFKKKVIFIHEL